MHRFVQLHERIDADWAKLDRDRLITTRIQDFHCTRNAAPARCEIDMCKSNKNLLLRTAGRLLSFRNHEESGREVLRPNTKFLNSP
jgi:hypothetical protein